MPLTRTPVCLSSVLLVAAVLASAQQQPSSLAFVGVTVVPMDRERVVERQTVVVTGETIAAMGPADSTTVPPDAVRVEAAGRYLIPGLAEMHAHVPGGDAPDRTVEKVLFLYVANGVTTARGMLGHPRHLPLRERARRGELIAPTIYTSGPSLNGNSVPTPEAAARAVRDQKAAGYDFLKIHPGIALAPFETLAATAREAGIRLAGHVPLEVGLERALDVPYATIDHIDGYVEALVPPNAPVKPTDSQFFGVNLIDHVDASRIPALVARTREAGTRIVPTESLFEHLLGDVPAETQRQWPEMRYVTAVQLEQWTAQKRKFAESPEITPDMRKRYLELRRRLLVALHRGGVGILLGSDAPQMWNVPGFSIHRELRLMVAAGLTPYEALETGTRNVAEFFGTAQTTGTIAPGRRADLVLLAGNPLADVAQTSAPIGVVVGGRWLPARAIEQRLAEYVETPGSQP